MGHTLVFDLGWFMDALALLSALCWLGIYVQAIRIGFAERTFCIPAEALALNFAWEAIFGFMWEPTGTCDILQMWVNRFWCVLDVFIVYTCWRYGTSRFGSWKIYFTFIVILMFGLLGAMFSKYGASSQATSAFLMNILMSFLFLRTAMINPCQPKSIGWLKLIGTASISLVYLQSASDYPLIAVAGIGCFILDVMYVRLIMKH